MTGLVLLVALGATYRLTMLVTHDKLTEELRETVLARLSGHGLVGREDAGMADHIDEAFHHVYECRCREKFIGSEAMAQHVQFARDFLVAGWRRRVCYLVTCPWCVSYWIASAMMATAWAFGDRSWWFVPAAALTGSAVTGTWARFARPG